MAVNISQQQKRTILEQTKSTLLSDVYRACLVLGIDPDTFDISSWEQPDVIMFYEQQRLTEIKSSLELVESKLADLD
jgi:hypothetical protein